MNINKNSLFVACAAALTLASCSGPSAFVTQPGGGGPTPGNAAVTVLLNAAPPTPPTGVSVLSFALKLSEVSITPTGGAAVSGPSLTTSVDLARLQADSALLVSGANVPAGTMSTLAIGVLTASVTTCTVATSGTGCAPGSETTFSPTLAPISLTPTVTLTSGQETGLVATVNLTKALTFTGTAVSAVNLSNATVSVSSLPPTANNLPASTTQLDFLDDVTGIVSASSASSLTIVTANGTFTASATSPILSPNCLANTTLATCAVVGQVASADMIVNNDGKLTLAEFDPLAATAGDWIEGVVSETPASPTTFTLVTNNFVAQSSGSLIGSLIVSTPVQVTLANVHAGGFSVDTKGLTVSASNFTGSSDTSVIVPGQTVAVHVTAFTGSTGAGVPALATVDNAILRFTRISGVVATPGTSTVTMNTLPSFLGTQLATVQFSALSGTTVPGTNFDGVSNPSGITTGQSISISAIFFGPTISLDAIKVRVP